jgi:exopolysaccharide biosynthesis polyprenyl glycosylphosphotransferase
VLERISHRLTNSILFWDLVLTLFCLYITSHFRLWLPFGKPIYEWQVHLPWMVYGAVGFIWLIVFLLINPQRSIIFDPLIDAIGRLLAAMGLASLSFAGMLYLSPFREVSRLQFFYFITCNLLMLLIFHVLARSYFRSRQRQHTQRRVLIVGTEPSGQQIALEFLQRPWAGMQVIGYVSDDPLDDPRLPMLGTLNDTVAIVDREEIDEIIFALPAAEHHRMVDLSLALQCLPVMVHTIPSLLDLTFSRTSVGVLGGIPLISLRESTLSEAQRLIKRIFDLLTSSLLLLLMAPWMLLLALLIKLDSPGPIFFVQERVGEHGRRFRMLKFRSMYQDADQRWAEVALRDAEGLLLHKHANDPRITRMGRLLRRSSLDELPQLLNVLRGEMSLVGPRPEVPYIVGEYEAWQWQRFRVPPGMTGWWQVNGRSDKPMHMHTEDDLFYVQNYSLWLDLKILLRTIVVVLRGQGAY